MRSFAPSLILYTSFLATSANAFAGALVYGCLNYANPISKPFEASFKVGGGSTFCMNKIGSNAKVTVSSAGLTCVNLGYVESDAGWGCITEDSIWSLSYSALTKTGSTNSHWWWSTSNYNNVELQKETPGTVVCDNEALCADTKIHWPDQGPIYFIFSPEKSNAVVQVGSPNSGSPEDDALDKDKNDKSQADL